MSETNEQGQRPYVVLAGNSERELEDAVAAHIRRGYGLAAGAFIHPMDGRWCQSMMLKDSGSDQRSTNVGN